MKPFAALRNAVRHVIRLGRGREAALIYNGEGPAYREKTLGEWTALAKKDDFVVRKDAAWALAEIGLAAIPAIMELLKDKDTYANTTIALSLMGAEAKKRAIPALIELVQDKERDVQWAAIHALRIIGSLAVPSLTE
jgi:HEAT repeat protein